jgi:signal transduction histidine kinase
MLKKRNMLIMEGSTLILLLIVGGIALVYYALRERRHLEEVKHFFSTFSHDLKTSISRVVLQAEALPKTAEGSEKLKAFQKNLLALEMQLENSLHYAQQESRVLTLQAVDMKAVVSRLHTQWPDLKFNLQGSGRFRGDAVAVESIFKNLVSNAVLHGEADEINFRIIPDEAAVMIELSDNGKPVSIDIATLGKRLQASQKGTGIGLFLVQQWVSKLKGKIHFSKSERGSLLVVVTLPAAGGA